MLLTSGPAAGKASVYPFIVNPPAGQAPTPVLVQAAINTWQAYNAWGGKSLYAYNSTNKQAAVKVSFNRPFYSFYIGPYPYELDTDQFLERNGINADYYTDLDVSNDPQLLLGRQLDIAPGHDEYWTGSMRNAWDAARDAGVNLMFTAANDAYWQARYKDGGRTLVEYRSATLDPDPVPEEKTVAFRSLATPEPECQLIGEEFMSSGLELAFSSYPYVLAPGAAGDPLLAGTGIQPGQPLPNMVGSEYDSVVPGCTVPGPVHELLVETQSSNEADASYYRAPSGALVFASGSHQFSWGLTNWWRQDQAQPMPIAQPGIQKLMLNLLDADLGFPPTGF